MQETADNNCKRSKEKERSSDKCQVCEKSSQSVNNLKKHPNGTPGVKCKVCGNSFVKNSDLELHIKKIHQDAEMYECDKCDKKFLLNWRLKKHQDIHSTRENLKFCHYFNNGKECPYAVIGYMFKHEQSEQCKFKENYRNKLCQFKHDKVNTENLEKITESIEKEKVKENQAEILNPITWCEVCEYDYPFEDLEEHEVEIHDTSFYQKCGYCSYTVNNDSKIIRHSKSHKQ